MEKLNINALRSILITNNTKWHFIHITKETLIIIGESGSGKTMLSDY